MFFLRVMYLPLKKLLRHAMNLLLSSICRYVCLLKRDGNRIYIAPHLSCNLRWPSTINVRCMLVAQKIQKELSARLDLTRRCHAMPLYRYTQLQNEIEKIPRIALIFYRQSPVSGALAPTLSLPTVLPATCRHSSAILWPDLEADNELYVHLL